MLYLGLEEQIGIDADLVVEAFDLEADDAVHPRPGEQAEQQGAGIRDLVAGADFALPLDLASQRRAVDSARAPRGEASARDARMTAIERAAAGMIRSGSSSP